MPVFGLNAPLLQFGHFAENDGDRVRIPPSPPRKAVKSKGFTAFLFFIILCFNHYSVRLE